MQQLVMEADYDAFKIIPKYLKALPRASYDESHTLDLKLIERGQQIPIIVRRDMGILDGHTRSYLLGQRGIKIKYQFMDFPDEQSEFEFVVETNIMKRHLNMFQRIETMYQFFLDETLARREKDMTSQFDVMHVLSKGVMSTTDIEKSTKYTKRTVLRLLNELKDVWCVSREEDRYIKHKKGNGGTTMYTWKLLPKGVEILGKREPRKVGSVSNMIGKIIGAGRNSVTMATYIIEYGGEDMIQKCRDGILSVRGAHLLMSDNRGINQKGTKKNVWGRGSKIKCPNCKCINVKEKYTKIEE